MSPVTTVADIVQAFENILSKYNKIGISFVRQFHGREYNIVTNQYFNVQNKCVLKWHK